MAKLVGLWVMMHLAVSAALATTLVPPRPKIVSSPNSELIVRIDVGDRSDRLYAYRDVHDSRNSFATYFRRDIKSGAYVPYMTVTLPQPIMPLGAIVNDAGYLVTINDYKATERGPAVAILSPDGVLVKSYKLSELYEKSVLEKIPILLVGPPLRLWGHSERRPIMNSESIQLFDTFGNSFLFYLSDGSYEYRRSRKQ